MLAKGTAELNALSPAPHSTKNIMTILQTIWRRSTFGRSGALLRLVKATASVIAAGARRTASALSWKTRYTRGIDAAVAREREKSAWQNAEIARLREEIVRVRAENRALLNSILGIAGIPPIPVAFQDARVLETPNTNSAAPPRCHPAAQSGPEAPAWSTSADKPHLLGTPVASSTRAENEHPLGNASASGPVSPFSDSSDTEVGDRVEHIAAHKTQVDAAIAGGKGLQKVTAPMRRRSWQQINRTLEIEAARKKAGRDADALDA